MIIIVGNVLSVAENLKVKFNKMKEIFKKIEAEFLPFSLPDTLVRSESWKVEKSFTNKIQETFNFLSKLLLLSVAVLYGQMGAIFCKRL